MIQLMLLFSLPPLLICIAVLAIAFRHWRKYPILQDAINLKRPRWLTLFISCGIGSASFAAICGLDHLSKYTPRSGPPNMFGGPFDGMIIFCLIPLALAAIVCSFFSAVWCLYCLVSSLLSHVRSLQSKQG